MFRRSLAVLFLAALATGVLGCGEKAEQQAEAAKSQAAAVQEHAMQVSAVLAEHLAKADAVDGQVDHVVANCSGCKLKMAGSENYTMMVGDYTLRFCSATCKDKLTQGGEEALLALEIPEADGHEGHGH